MQISIIADQSVFTAALDAAEQVNHSDTLSGLHAPADGVFLGRVGQAWEAIKEALTTALEYGAERVGVALESAWQSMEEALRAAGAKAGEMQALLLSRLREYLGAFVDGMLQQLRSELRVGTVDLNLRQVQLSQKVMLSSSLKASLKEVVALTSQGELQVDASYGIAPD
ncbi:hypothetical protein HMI51_14100 [Corallococcus coralloides]|nr:hypothetical protein [Corallococcus coralloides]